MENALLQAAKVIL
jgi:hypothetical protein